MSQPMIDPTFYPFYFQKLQERLSGTSVMSLEQAETIQQSLEYVLKHGEGETLPIRFEQGKKQLEKKLTELQQLYHLIQANYQSFGIESLDGSIEEIGDFFKHYDLDYGAAEVDQAFINYQLAIPVPTHLKGIDFYECYLRRLAAEVLLVKHLPVDQITELLEIYQEKLGFDYRQDINNLFEIIFRQLIGRLLVTKKQNDSLLLSREEAEYAFNRLRIESKPVELVPLFNQADYYHQVFQQLQTICRETPSEDAVHFFIRSVSSKRRLTFRQTMPQSSFNQWLKAYYISNRAERIKLLTDEDLAPEDFIELLEIVEEDSEFRKEVFKRLNKNFIITLCLWVIKGNNLSNPREILDLTEFGEIQALLKNHLKTLSGSALHDLLQTINMYQLSKFDFS
ncbi:MAG: DUF6179 domain-containing protein [Enterococcus devriesei]|uniref:DUF6179 domain-containing protein n=1 Tax=Enterococcus devriesei TaxID=319970 RepID=UPI003F92BE85